MLALLLAACGFQQRSDSTSEIDVVDETGLVGDDTAPVDSEDTVPVGETWDDVAAVYDQDGDLYLSEATPKEKIEQILNGEIANVPAEVINNLNDNYDPEVDTYRLDCDDDFEDGAISHPDSTEVVDGYDNDCDGYAEVNPQIDAVVYPTTSSWAVAPRVVSADVNGDGFPDQIIGQSYDSISNTRDGSIKIYFGPVPGIEPDVTLHGNGYDDGLGGVMAVDDFDGDEISDILSVTESWLGAGIYYGRSDTEWATTTSPDAIFTDNNVEFLGSEVQAGNGELFMETTNAPIIHHIPQRANTADGRYSGTQPIEDVLGWKKIFDSGALSGQLTMTTGDYDADGTGDVVIGNPTSANGQGKGTVTVLYGPLADLIDSNNPPASSKILVGENDGDGAGGLLTTGKTKYTDNLDEIEPDYLVVSAPQQGGPGRGYIIPGDILSSLPNDSQTILDGPATVAGAIALVANDGDTFFPDTACTGDMDGDGFDDLVVTANVYDGQLGGVLFFSGQDLLAESGHEISIAASQKAGFEMGILENRAGRIACNVDLTGDGAADLLAPVSTGDTYLFRGGNHGINQ